MLYNQILKVISPLICESESDRVSFLKRIEEGALTRDENSQSHFCVYFLPYNPQDKKVFIVHHKKSGLWLSPGGHIDKGEQLLGTLNREMNEELGLKNFLKEAPSPFLLTITPIENKTHPCKTHFDIWYLINTNGDNFNIDQREFHETRWLTVNEAENLVTDPPNRKALELVKMKR